MSDKDCSECKGSGTYQYMNPLVDPFDFEDDERDCESCHGTGKEE